MSGAKLSAKALRALPRRQRRALWLVARNGAPGDTRRERAAVWRQSWRDVADMRAPVRRWFSEHVPNQRRSDARKTRRAIAYVEWMQAHGG